MCGCAVYVKVVSEQQTMSRCTCPLASFTFCEDISSLLRVLRGTDIYDDTADKVAKLLSIALWEPLLFISGMYRQPMRSIIVIALAKVIIYHSFTPLRMIRCKHG